LVDHGFEVSNAEVPGEVFLRYLRLTPEVAMEYIFHILLLTMPLAFTIVVLVNMTKEK
jgi:hypothetical protein